MRQKDWSAAGRAHGESGTGRLRSARRLAGLTLGCLLLAGLPPALCAQTASEITPAGLQPPLQRLQGRIEFTGRPGLGAPEGADRLTILVAGVAIEGGRPEMADATRATEARLTAGRIPVSEIFEAAQDLEAAYAEAGFVLARVVLPEQSLSDGGRLRLVVVDGFFEAIETDAVPPPVRARIEALTRPLQDRPGVPLRDIERALLLAGDTFGVALDSALTAGQQPGAARLVLDADFRSLTGHVGFGNAYDDALGEVALDAGIEANGYLGLAETVYLRAAVSPDDSDASGPGTLLSATPLLRTLAAGAAFPIGTDGLTFNIEGTESRTAPRTDAGDLPTRSLFERLSFRLGVPVVRSRRTNLSALLILDLQTDALDALLGDERLALHRDRLRVLRASGSYLRALDEGVTLELGAAASVGLDAFGARGAEDATAELPLSRQGADADFAKLELSGRFERPLGPRLALALRGRAQTSFGDPLVTSERFGIASPSELSTFASGTATGDSGVFGRADLSLPLQTEGGAAVSPYAFIGTGALFNERPTALERDRTTLTSLGLGVALVPLSGSRFSGATIRAEFGRGLRDDDAPDETRFTLVGSYRF